MRLAIGLSLLACALVACGSAKNAPTAMSDASPDTSADASDGASDHASSSDVGGDSGPVDATTSDLPGEAAADGASGSADASGAEPPGDAGSDLPADASPDVVDSGPPLASGTPWRAIAISTGITHACALLDNHQVKCWGMNAFAAIGTGDDADRGQDPAKMGNALPFVNLGTGRTAVAIAAGRYTTCAILDNGQVKCWGLRRYTGAPTNPHDDDFAGNQPSDLGDALPDLDLGAGHTALHLANGYDSTCAVLDDRSARCWGSGAPVAPVAIDSSRRVLQLSPAYGKVFALFDDGGISDCMPTGNVDLTLAPGEKATYIAGSELGSCAVLSDGRASCAGRPANVTGTTDVAAIDVGKYHTCVLTKTGQVRCWGTDCNNYPPGTKYWCPDKPLADGSVVVALGQPAKALGTAGIDFSCAMLADGAVKCWTSNDFCTNPGGLCAVPEQTPSILGGAVSVTGTGKNRQFGEWRAIDLGTRP